MLPETSLANMVRVSHQLAEIANLPPDTHQPYVGTSSFAHKAGLHASALRVDHDLYNHIDPTRVGNDMRVLVTEMAGRASVELKGAELGIDLADKPEVISTIVEQVKDLESEGGRLRPPTPRSNSCCATRWASRCGSSPSSRGGRSWSSAATARC